MTFLPLKSPDIWAHASHYSDLTRNPNAQQQAMDAGFDIHTSARILQEFYLRRYQEVQG